METGDIVISRAGHDAGKPFIVVAEVGAEFVLIADGELRRVENPKLKRKRHLRVADKSAQKAHKTIYLGKEDLCRGVTISKRKAL